MTNDRPPNFAIECALADIAALQARDLISEEMARRAREVVGLVFRDDSVYATISPDDGGVCFYWVAGDRSITIDLFPDGGSWVCARRGDDRKVHASPRGGVPRWLWDALGQFTEAVEAANPDWHLLRAGGVL